MADDDDAIFDVASAKLIAIVTRRVLGQFQGDLLLAQKPDIRTDPQQWHIFKNTSGVAIPGRAIMEVDSASFSWENRQGPLYSCKQPSTSFAARYAICHPDGVAAGAATGHCTFEGSVEILYKTGLTPTQGMGVGPVPGQWYVDQGYPSCTTVDGVVDSTNHLLWGTFSPIRSMLGKTIGSITALTPCSTTASYKIYAGTQGSETDAGFTTVPAAVSRVNIASGKWIELTLINNGVEMEPLECP